MFSADVISLRRFYASMPGRLVQRVLLQALNRCWPEWGKDRLGVIGYGVPLLEAEEPLAACSVQVMPAHEGALYWPPGGSNLSVMADEWALPVQTECLNRVVVLHTLEMTRHVNRTLKEIHRLLVPGGRALLIVPNRTGLWALSGNSPFGCGQPFSTAQLSRRALENGLTPVGGDTVLYVPPLSWRWVMKIAPGIEWIGRLLLPGLGGVLVMEVEKQVYATIPDPATARPRPVLAPLVSASSSRI